MALEGGVATLRIGEQRRVLADPADGAMLCLARQLIDSRAVVGSRRTGFEG